MLPRSKSDKIENLRKNSTKSVSDLWPFQRMCVVYLLQQAKHSERSKQIQLEFKEYCRSKATSAKNYGRDKKYMQTKKNTMKNRQDCHRHTHPNIQQQKYRNAYTNSICRVREAQKMRRPRLTVAHTHTFLYFIFIVSVCKQSDNKYTQKMLFIKICMKIQ